MTRAHGIPALQRRVLPLADCKVVHLTAADGTIQIRGHGTIHYQPLCFEHWEALTRYMPEAVARTREFLLSGSCDWTESGGRVVPVFLIGWPDGPQAEVVGAKACAETLRRFYPARDYQDGGTTEDAAADQPEAQGDGSKVVRLNAPAAMRGMLEQQRWDDRG